MTWRRSVHPYSHPLSIQPTDPDPTLPCSSLPDPTHRAPAPPPAPPSTPAASPHLLAAFQILTPPPPRLISLDASHPHRRPRCPSPPPAPPPSSSLPLTFPRSLPLAAARAGLRRSTSAATPDPSSDPPPYRPATAHLGAAPACGSCRTVGKASSGILRQASSDSGAPPRASSDSGAASRPTGSSAGVLPTLLLDNAIA